jgi:hypothetical protein
MLHISRFAFILIVATIGTYFLIQQFRSFDSGQQYLRTTPFSEELSLSLPSPPALPSVRLSAEEEEKVHNKRKKYGGVGDKLHLGKCFFVWQRLKHLPISGGFTALDTQGLSTNVFNYMLGPLAIKSIIDVGCGKGVSTKTFLDNGAKVLCVEGSHDAVLQSLLPPSLIIEHDFTRGPWWPAETYDAVWSVEFLEHVSRDYMANYLPIFKRAALLFVTSSGFGGWHHVEIHEQYWWRVRLAANGFIFSEDLTERVRRYASDGRDNPSESQHLVHGMQVFINPSVASLRKHQHIMGGWGCNSGVIDNSRGGRECEGSDSLTSDFISLLDCKLNVTGEEVEGKARHLWICKRDGRATHPLT